jgi:serine/threonine protein phosphatase PrpC
MLIKIHPPLAMCEKGKRSKNEDNIYPTLGASIPKSRTFIVCDGVGGAAKGEVASRVVSTVFGNLFDQKMATVESLQEALDRAQAELDAYVQRTPENKGMGTTLTFLQFNNCGAVIAHAGDSRVYHIRKDKILFCTYDHSLVNDLVKMGKTEEAELAPRNIITRAIQGSTIKKIELDVRTVSDIQVDDYFFLCSDGVWGTLSDGELISIMDSDTTDVEKINSINHICNQSSKDNYSAYLIKIKEIMQIKQPSITKRIAASDLENFKSVSQQNVLVEDTRKTGVNWVAILILIVIIGLIGFLYGLILLLKPFSY